MGTKKIFCSLCSNSIRKSNFLEVKEDIRAVLDVLQLKLIQEENNKAAICNACSVSLFSAFNFKAVCMDTEDCLFPYVNSANGTLIDLRNVYLEERNKKHLKGLLREEKICRLCMNVTTSGFTSVKKMDGDVLGGYLAKINFNSTKDPVICKTCFGSLTIHSNFLTRCFKAEKTVKDIHADKIIEPFAFVKLENVEQRIMPEESSAGNNYSEKNKAKATSPALDIKKNRIAAKPKTKPPLDQTPTKRPKRNVNKAIEKNLPNDLPLRKEHICDICGQKFKKLQPFQLHQLTHGDCPDLPLLECKECDYKTKRRPNYKRHVLTHKGFQEGRVFQCEKCGLRTRSKQNLERHQLVHVEFSATLTYKCEICGMETIHKSNFKKHQATHGDRSVVRMFKCEECEFETIHKFSLDNHVIRHRDLAELEKYKCELCNFVTPSKAHLATHRYNHTGPRSYECHKCAYSSKWKAHLARHLLTHRKDCKRPLYQCDECGFSTRNKKYFRSHQIHHRYVALGVTHNCNKCGFESV